MQVNNLNNFNFSYDKLCEILTNNKVSFNFSDENIDKIIKMSQINKITELEISEIITDCIYNRKLDYIKLATAIRELKQSKTPITGDKITRMVYEFDNTSFEQFLGKLNKGTISNSELSTMRKLKEETNLSNGVINVIIGHGINEQSGSVPSLQYFIKIAAEWIRKDIVTTKVALEYVYEFRKKRLEYKNNPITNKTQYKNNYKNNYNNKNNNKVVPSWVDQAIDDLFDE